MNRYKTASKSYFQQVIEAMRKHGLEFLGWVTVNSKRHPYHVDWFEFVQESRLVFHVPGKAFIVVLAYTEIFSKGTQEYNCYWGGRIVCGYNWKKMFPQGLDLKTANDTMLFRLVRQPYCSAGGSRTTPCRSSYQEQIVEFESWPEAGRLSPDVVASIVPPILTEVAHYLEGQFKGLAKYHIQTSAFKGAAVEAFWSRFPVDRLYRKINGQLW